MKTSGASSRLNRKAAGRTRALCLATIALLVIVSVMFLASAVVLAKDKSQEKPYKPQQKRFNKMPAVQFIRGPLSRDHLTNWKLNETRLFFGPKSVITDQRRSGDEVQPREGDDVLLMGYWSGGAFVVVRGVRFPAIPLTGMSMMDARPEKANIIWSEVDPSVGWGKDFE